MTQVDFYVVGTSGEAARFMVACRIADKAVRLAQRVFIRTQSDADAEKLDELLWTFSDRSFLPHRRVNPAEDETSAALPVEPVLIGQSDGPTGPHRDLLINLAATVAADATSFARIADIVGADPDRKRQGRERYRYYRDLGIKPLTHDV